MNALKTTFLLGAMTGLLLAMGELLGGRDGLTLALLLAGVMNFGAWFWSDCAIAKVGTKAASNINCLNRFCIITPFKKYPFLATRSAVERGPGFGRR